MMKLITSRVAAACLLAGAVLWLATVGSRRSLAQGAQPATGTASVAFNANNATHTTTAPGMVRITAAKPKLVGGAWDPTGDTLDISVPVAQGTNMAGVAAAVMANLPAGWQGNASTAGNVITFTEITKIDGSPGNTQMDIFFTATKEVTVVGGKGKVIKGGKNPGSDWRGGKLTLFAAGRRTNAQGDYEVVSDFNIVWFAGTDSAADVILRIRDRLQANGYVVNYDPSADAEALEIVELPGGVPADSVTLGVAYDDGPGTDDWHWALTIQPYDD